MKYKHKKVIYKYFRVNKIGVSKIDKKNTEIYKNTEKIIFIYDNK